MSALTSLFSLGLALSAAQAAGQRPANSIADLRSRLGASASIAVTPCTTQGLPADTVCGSAEVPENRSLKKGRMLRVHWAVLPATGPVTDDPLAVLPGGPGLGGVQSGGGLARLFSAFRKNRDILLIDQRGTGQSNPLHCPPKAGSETNPLAALEAPDPPEITVCREILSKKADVRHYHTREAVKDMEAIRAGIGYQRLDLLGVSYGSRLALDYLRLYPTRTGETFIRAAAPPEMRLPLNSARDSQAAFNRLAAMCRAQPDCAARHPNLERDLEMAIERLSKGPIPTTIQHPGTKKDVVIPFERSTLGASIFFMLYVQNLYPQLPPLIEAAAQGNFAPLAQAAAPSLLGLAGLFPWGMRWSVICEEDVRRVDLAQIPAATRKTFIGEEAITHEIASCKRWPKYTVPADYLAPVSSDKPVLILSGTMDPIAGVNWGNLIARTLPNSKHLVLNGASHLPPFPFCSGDIALEFLNGRQPKDLDTSCLSKSEPPKLKAAAAKP